MARGRPRKLPIEDAVPKEEPKPIEAIAQVDEKPAAQALNKFTEAFSEPDQPLAVPQEAKKPIKAGEKITGRGAFRKPDPLMMINGQHVSVKEMAQEESRKVTGRFSCFSPLGGEVCFYFRKYRDQPIEKYHLKDGEIYEVPLSVARHLQDGCYEEIHVHSLDKNGAARRDVGRRVKRFEFVPLGF